MQRRKINQIECLNMILKEREREREIGNPPKLKPYLAIKALLTSIIPTDVTTLNIHEAKSRAPFLSDSFAEVIFFSILEFVAAIFTAQPS